MKHQRLSLDGPWELEGLDPAGGRALRLAGRVPGHVTCDLLAAGLIPDPFRRDQARACEWVEHWEWRYTSEFEIPEDFELHWADLEFEGLDTFATVLLNGREAGRAANMFIPHRFAAGPLLAPGRNRIEVRLAPLAEALAGQPLDRYFACFAPERVYARKMQCAFGWDWAPRLAGPGVWRPVVLHAYDKARLTDLFIGTVHLDELLAGLSINITAERWTSDPTTVRLVIHDPQGRPVWSLEHDAEQDPVQVAATLPQPQLWWPNGWGEQPLYTLSASLHGADGALLDERRTEFGIRTLALEETPDAPGSSFILRVNGRRMFAKGANWVPADIFPARVTPERYDRLLGLARDAHCNMLRAWGGGIYEPEPFWRACDRLGLLVAQDFMLACAQYPEDDPAFMDQLRAEFAAAIRLLRNHPSLALWCGDNELGMNNAPTEEYPGKKIAAEISGPLCRALDPARPFRPTSPFGGSLNNSPAAGDCHVSAWYAEDLFRSDMRDYRRRIERAAGRFVSEYAVMGAPPVRSLLKFMDPADLADPEAAMLEFHTRDNPYKGFTDLTHYRMLELTARRLFGDIDHDYEHEHEHEHEKGVGGKTARKIARMEYAHYKWIRLAAEALRRKKFDCAGLLFWMFNDCWPALGWSVVDYYGFPKAGYHALRRAFTPLAASIEETEDGLRVWVCNDRLEPVEGELSLEIQTWTGERRWRRGAAFTAPANASIVAQSLTRAELDPVLDSQSVLTCDLRAPGEDFNRAWFHPGLPGEMNLPRATLEVQRTGPGEQGSLKIRADRYARVVTLDADLDFSDNYFDLLAGEERTIRWTSPAGLFQGTINVNCWNGVERNAPCP